MPGLRPKASAETRLGPILAAACLAFFAAQGSTQEIASPLTGSPGDPARGREIVSDPARGLCVLCHAGPFPEHRFMGDLAPPLDGIGDRLTVAQIRARIVDSRLANPDTIMPPFHATTGLRSVGERWQGETILTAEEVEDVVAYLATLKEDAR